MQARYLKIFSVPLLLLFFSTTVYSDSPSVFYVKAKENYSEKTREELARLLHTNMETLDSLGFNAPFTLSQFLTYEILMELSLDTLGSLNEGYETVSLRHALNEDAAYAHFVFVADIVKRLSVPESGFSHASALAQHQAIFGLLDYLLYYVDNGGRLPSSDEALVQELRTLFITKRAVFAKSIEKTQAVPQQTKDPQEKHPDINAGPRLFSQTFYFIASGAMGYIIVEAVYNYFVKAFCPKVKNEPKNIGEKIRRVREQSLWYKHEFQHSFVAGETIHIQRPQLRDEVLSKPQETKTLLKVSTDTVAEKAMHEINKQLRLEENAQSVQAINVQLYTICGLLAQSLSENTRKRLHGLANKLSDRGFDEQAAEIRIFLK